MSNPETASIIERLIACRDTLKVVERQYSVNLQPERAAMADAATALAALAQPKEATLSDEVVERAARADADMAAALLEGLEALANTPMNIDLSVWSRFAFNVQMIAKRLRRAAITPAGGVEDERAVLEAALDRMGWPEIHNFQAELRRGQDVYEDAGGYFMRAIKRLFGLPGPDEVITYKAAARAMLATSPTRDEGRNPSQLWARDLTDAELIGEYRRNEEACDRFDEARRDPDYEGHGGSPGEGLYERSGELEGQLKKRGLWPVPHQEGAVR